MKASFTAQDMQLHFEIQQLLFHEASLLDNWQLEDWLDLYADDAMYLIPPPDADETTRPARHLYYVADDKQQLNERVTQLLEKTSHSEFPRSKVRHLVSNIQVTPQDDGTLNAAASFVVYRSKGGLTDTFIGHYTYRLVRTEGALKIKEKECKLDLDELHPQGKISIIL